MNRAAFALLKMSVVVEFLQVFCHALYFYMHKIINIRVSFRGGGGHLPPLESYVPPLEFALHTPTLHGADP